MAYGILLKTYEPVDQNHKYSGYGPYDDKKEAEFNAPHFLNDYCQELFHKLIEEDHYAEDEALGVIDSLAVAVIKVKDDNWLQRWNNLDLTKQDQIFSNHTILAGVDSEVSQKFFKDDTDRNLDQIAYDTRNEDLIPGGRGDNKTPEEIALKHGVPIQQIEAQIKKGMKVEMEHTNDRRKAEEITKDHLMEIPNYYDDLERMEKEAGVQEAFSNSDLIKGLQKLTEEIPDVKSLINNLEITLQHVQDNGVFTEDNFQTVQDIYKDLKELGQPINFKRFMQAKTDPERIDVVTKLINYYRNKGI